MEHHIVEDKEAWFANRHADPAYRYEMLAIETGEAVHARMVELGIGPAEVARRAGLPRARITQVLRGDDRMTLKTLVAVADALGASVRLDLPTLNLAD